MKWIIAPYIHGSAAHSYVTYKKANLFGKTLTVKFINNINYNLTTDRLIFRSVNLFVVKILYNKINIDK